jgi:hypothetical protein
VYVVVLVARVHIPKAVLQITFEKPVEPKMWWVVERFHCRLTFALSGEPLFGESDLERAVRYPNLGDEVVLL